MISKPSGLEALKREHDALLKLVQALVIVLVVFSASLNVFLLREVTLVCNDLKQRQLVIDQYNQTGREKFEAFLSEMERFAVDHPGFAPILNTYFPATNQVAVPDIPPEVETNSTESTESNP